MHNAGFAVLASLFKTQTIAAIAEVLAAAGVDDGAVVVVANPRVAAGLAEHGVRVVQVAPKPRSLRRARGTRVYGLAHALPLADRVVTAVVGFGSVNSDAQSTLVSEWSRVIGEGGTLVLVDRVAAGKSSAAALCGGLAEIRQRTSGRDVITSGVVVHLDDLTDSAA